MIYDYIIFYIKLYTNYIRIFGDAFFFPRMLRPQEPFLGPQELANFAETTVKGFTNLKDVGTGDVHAG